MLLPQLALTLTNATVITAAMLNEGDVDDSGAGLTYTITTAPVNGVLRLSGTVLNASDTFTQAELDAGYSSLVAELAHDLMGASRRRFGIPQLQARRRRIAEGSGEPNERLADQVLVCTAARSAIGQALEIVDRGWTILLFVYAFLASTLPVTTLLQPRDYINAWQLLIAMILLVLGWLFIFIGHYTQAIRDFGFQSPTI